MKIVTYTVETKLGPTKRLGILLDPQTVFDPNLAWKSYYSSKGFYNTAQRADHICPSSLFAILNLKENPLEFLLESLSLKDSLDKKVQDLFTFKLTEALFLSCPLDKIATYRDFYTHEKHVAAGFKKRHEPIPKQWYQIPAYYKGATTGFIGNNETIPWPSYTNVLDYELELAMVIGKEGKNISRENAIGHIFGFTVLNDISARDIQKQEMAVRLGPAKGKDFCSILGPVITTIDEFNFQEPNLLMSATINGELWSKGQSADSHFSWASMIEHVANDEWIRAGDLFGSGTVGTGCGLELDKWIKEGDTIDLFIEGIGHLKNTVGKKERRS